MILMRIGDAGGVAGCRVVGGWDGMGWERGGSSLRVYQAYGQTLVSPKCHRPERTPGSLGRVSTFEFHG